MSAWIHCHPVFKWLITAVPLKCCMKHFIVLTPVTSKVCLLNLFLFYSSPLLWFWFLAHQVCADFVCVTSPPSLSCRFGGWPGRSVPAAGRRAGQGSLKHLEKDAFLQTAGRLQNNMARVAQKIQAQPNMWVWPEHGGFSNNTDTPSWSVWRYYFRCDFPFVSQGTQTHPSNFCRNQQYVIVKWEPLKRH